MEKIVCYLDGRTLLQFKLLSKTCYNIASNALRFNKLWKKICLTEIPKKYFITLFNKHFDKFTSLYLLSENEYEKLYKHWLQWQSSVFNVKRIGQHHFLGYDVINKVICHKHDVMVVFSSLTSVFSLLKNLKEENYVIKNNGLKPRYPGMLIILNPRPETTESNAEQNQYMTCNQKYCNRCPLHSIAYQVHDGNFESKPIGKLIDVDTNIYTNVCCWVRESWYEWHSNDASNVVNGHYCQKLINTIYTSVVHGVIISLSPGNRIVVHDIYKNSCTTIHSWLDRKYVRATALYIYTDILFVGTQNSYLLAYRLQSWDDLIHPKKKNMLLEIKLHIGKIEKIDIMDYKNVKAVIVASTLSIYWLKVN